MSFSIVNTSIATGGTNSSSVTIDTTGADIIVLVIGKYLGTDTTAPTDSQSNTWTRLVTKTQGNFRGQLWYCISPTTNASHTFTFSEAFTYTAIAVVAAASTGTVSVDNSSSASATSATSVENSSLTPSIDNCLVVTGMMADPGGTSITIDESYSAATRNRVNGTNVGSGIAYLIQTTATATSPTWSWASSSTGITTMGIFKDDAGGGSIVPILMSHYRRRRIA